MKKLKKERKKFNRDYLKPLLGCIVLFVLLVIFMIIIGYNPKEEESNKTKNNNYHLNIDDNLLDVNTTCDTNFYKSVIDNVNKIDVGLKVTTVEGEKIVDSENSDGDNIVYYTRKYYGYDVNLNNIPENIKVVIKDNKTENVYTLNKDQSSFTTIYTIEKVVYTVSIYGDVDNCKDALLRQFNFTTPVLNSLAETPLCQSSNDKNCDLVTYEETNISALVKKEIEKDIKENDEKKNNVKNIVIGSLLIVIIIAIVVFVYFKRRRKRMVM